MICCPSITVRIIWFYFLSGCQDENTLFILNFLEEQEAGNGKRETERKATVSHSRNRWEVKGHKSLSPTKQVIEFLQPRDWTTGLGGGTRGELHCLTAAGGGTWSDACWEVL